jgi:hypothetical protein
MLILFPVHEKKNKTKEVKVKLPLWPSTTPWIVDWQPDWYSKRVPLEEKFNKWVLDSCGCECSHYCLLGCDAVQFCK